MWNPESSQNEKVHGPPIADCRFRIPVRRKKPERAYALTLLTAYFPLSLTELFSQKLGNPAEDERSRTWSMKNTDKQSMGETQEDGLSEEG